MATSLAQQLREQNEAGRARIPAEALAVMDQATAEVAASGIAGSSLGVGATVPDFELPDANGTKVSLSALLAEGPVVLAFYRGGWCPYCSTELRALQAKLAEITAAGATLVAVSPQTPDASLSTAEKLDLAFPVLSDAGNQVAESFGLVFSLPEALREVYTGFGLDLPAANGDDTFRLPIPATYVIRAEGTVAWRFADPDYTKRAEPADVLAALAAL
jgi:peroxiredoxin